jgi:hypothetical protein
MSGDSLDEIEEEKAEEPLKVEAVKEEAPLEK